MDQLIENLYIWINWNSHWDTDRIRLADYGMKGTKKNQPRISSGDNILTLTIGKNKIDQKILPSEVRIPTLPLES